MSDYEEILWSAGFFIGGAALLLWSWIYLT